MKRDKKLFSLTLFFVGAILFFCAFFVNPARNINCVYADEITETTNDVESEITNDETVDVYDEDLSSDNQESDDIIATISDFIDEIWGKVSIWVPATLLPSLALIWKIIKNAVNLVSSKNQKKLTDEAIKKLQDEAAELKTKLIGQVENLKKYTDILEQLIVNQINPKVRAQLNDALETLKSLNLDIKDKELASTIVETEQVLDELDVDTQKDKQSYVYTGD